MVFPERSSVCFIGDSIMAADKFTRILIDFFALYFPEREILFHNISMPGATVVSALRSADRILEYYRPTHVFFLFGTNDLQRVLFSDTAKVTEALQKKRDAALAAYLENIQALSKTFAAVPHIFLTSPPHEESSCYPAPYYHGFNKQIARAATALCAQLPNVIDLYSFLSERNNRRILPSLLGPDRVHPENICHILMADHILRHLGFENPRLPLWDTHITTAERALLPEFGILDAEAAKHPCSDARFESTRKFLSVYYMENGILPSLGVKGEEATPLLQKELQKPIEPWRRACILDYIENTPRLSERQKDACRAMQNMYTKKV